jgi:hypothetical protein
MIHRRPERRVRPAIKPGDRKPLMAKVPHQVDAVLRLDTQVFHPRGVAGTLYSVKFTTVTVA